MPSLASPTEDTMGRLRAFIALAVAVVVTACSGSVTAPPVLQPTAAPLHSIRHVVILLQENRSFNNLFMGFPGADTASSGKCKNVDNEAPWCPRSGVVTLTRVTLESDGAYGFGQDLDHSHRAFEVECDLNAAHICRMDGFDLINFGAAGSGSPARLYPYKYVVRRETKPYWALAQQYTLADHMFFTATAASFIAHQQIIAGTTQISATESLTDQPDNMPWGCDAPRDTQVDVLLSDGREIYAPHPGLPFPCFTQYKTMADLLDAANATWRYYVDPWYGTEGDFSGGVWNGFDAIRKVRYGPDWKAHVIEPNSRFFTDLKRGALPEVSWVIPNLADSDHPASGCNGGPRWITSVVNAIGTSKYWSSTAIVLLWDDWGGWYDNVAPPQINYTSLGFRVPMIVISPYAKPHYVSRTEYNFGSVLKFVEQNFGLGSLGTTDATANSMNDVFDFTQRANVFKPAPLPSALPCYYQAAPSAREIIEHDGAVPE
jgi:phospholipase C